MTDDEVVELRRDFKKRKGDFGYPDGFDTWRLNSLTPKLVLEMAKRALKRLGNT